MRPVDPAPGMSDQVTPDSEAPSSEKPAGSKATPASAPYRVLARKYRPASFDALIGQEALVRTLTNAIDSGRLAQAWMLTGVRGVGKTTTARLIARALNCVGADGKGGVTITPCGVCEHCKAIAEDRHVDVLEMDAASRTGVGDIREILDGVRYRPAVARTKVYIIDEVHMLSTAAFNALLKTLEEPPEHVKFIFATTEIRKVPVTVLSRCQRFDLRRVSAAELSGHFLRIAGLEGAEIAPSALTLIARAADGSVRDGLSLLDQAIAHGGGTVSEAQVAEMLGLADRARIFDLLDALLAGRIAESLDLLDRQYALGADPLVIVQDLLDLVHWMTRVKVVPVSAEDAAVPEAERTRGRAMAERLSMAVLNRCWQILLKGLGEARGAPVPLQAVEMVLIRLAYASDLPTPEEALKMIAGGAQPAAPAKLAGQITRLLGEWTGRRWMVTLTDRPGQPTLHDATQADIHAHPLVKAVLDRFPGAVIGTIREHPGAVAAEADSPDLLGDPGEAYGAPGFDTPAGADPDDLFDPFIGDDET
ncbi:hypothetical protein CKO38_16165 [Rhodospirillum rubrum]|uniref:DNA polymerase III subunit gamma/tau n=1 Tax=Rhodospirillum rubrum TaxID=1085 RepID=UPI0019070549|nr:DNA polymerase III subunit gamma/tau [Rhodospirillum rubrum]MBK1678179.1 hypothetical protein [Rhodospirillum rubrum]